jgi:hypothetical protein
VRDHVRRNMQGESHRHLTVGAMVLATKSFVERDLVT